MSVMVRFPSPPNKPPDGVEPSFFPFDSGLERFSIAGSRNDATTTTTGTTLLVEHTHRKRTAGMGAKRPKGEESFFMLEKVTKV